MTKEERIKKYNTPVEVKCTRCGTNFIMSRSGYNYRIRIGNGNPEILCKSCRSIKASEHASSLWNNLTEDQKKNKMNKMQSAANTWMNNMSDEEKDKWKKNISNHAKERWKNYTEEELNMIS